MREILFRGKRKDNGEWAESHNILQLNNDKVYVPNSREEIFYAENEAGNVVLIDGVLYSVIPETVGQYTGLHDKNGTKIFEGDIVRLSYVGKNRGVSGKNVVTFKSGKFGVEWGWHKEFVSLDGFANTTMEVIGNIHDNKELLDVK